MRHNKYAFGRLFVAILGLFMVVACGDSGGNTEVDGTATEAAAPAVTAETSSKSVTDSEALTEALPTDATGTWGDIVYGATDAPLTVIEYASLTCPHCGTFAKTVFPKIDEDYISTGKVKFVYRNFLLNRVDLAASTVARCGDIETTKKLMKVFFSRQSEWMSEKDPLDGLAALARRTVNMSRVEFDACLSNKDMHTHLVEMTTEGQKKFNISGTPTIVVDGKALDGNGWDTVKDAIEAAL